MKRTYQIAGVAFFLISVFFARESLELGLGSSVGPGPGFLPFWASAMVGLAAVAMACRATFLESEPMPADFFASRTGYLRIGAIIVAIVAAAVLMNPLGFRLTMLTFFSFLLLALGRQNVILSASIAFAGSFGTYHVFYEWLKVPLPVGMFGM